MADPWKNIQPTVPTDDLDFDQVIVEPPRKPVNIPQEDESHSN